MDIGNTVSTAFRITWQHKKLWLIALLPWIMQVILGSVMLVVAMVSGLVPLLISSFSSMGRPRFEAAQFEQQFFAAIGSAAISLICVGLIALVVSIIVQLVTSGALVDGVWQAQNRNSVDIGSALRAGLRSAGRMFGSVFLLLLPLLLLYVCGSVALVALGVGAARNEDQVGALIGSMFCLIFPLFCINIIYALVVGGINAMATPAIVLNNEGAIQALGTGWRLLRQNLGTMIALWLVLIGIGIAVFTTVGLVSQIFTGPAIAQLQSQLQNFNTNDPAAVLKVFGAALSPIFWAAAAGQQLLVSLIGLLVTIVATAIWTLAYGQFENKLVLLPGGDSPSLPPPSLPAS